MIEIFYIMQTKDNNNKNKQLLDRQRTINTKINNYQIDKGQQQQNKQLLDRQRTTTTKIYNFQIDKGQ